VAAVDRRRADGAGSLGLTAAAGAGATLRVMPTASTPSLRIRVRGRVQGVGFRPFVHGLAKELGLDGTVCNDAEGVLVEAWGVRVGELPGLLGTRAPPLSRIDAIDVQGEAAGAAPAGFRIVDTVGGGRVHTQIGPDAATCEHCLDELFDPRDRRHLHPFITCTHCGPRYTITERLPYDRPQTAMAGFPLCPACTREYTDPADRRFHAETTCCPDCGPRLSMPPAAIWDLLAGGAIVAIKGIGGYHLACDATNEIGVARLRARKQREAKPLAVMVANVESARLFADLDPAQTRLLASRERPIVVLDARAGSGIAPSVSQSLPTLGLLLPYTPIHHLLFHAAIGAPADPGWRRRAWPIALVMTSANPHGEPLVHTDADARLQLAGIADVIVDHDRAIVVRCDDSVLRIVDGAPAFIRRARGFVPEPIDLGRDFPPLLATGAYLKNTVCVTRGREAFVSQHIGDLDGPQARRFFQESCAHLLAILDVRPERIAVDLHPDFPGRALAQASGVPWVAVQHHHAHIAAVLAEHQVDGPALGLALDGYGYGSDGTAWGGELLRVDGARCERVGHLAPLAQPGGDRCTRETWRCASAAMHALGLGGEIVARFGNEPLAPAVARLLAAGGVATSTSAGRWFDAACGLLGLHLHSAYEGQAPMALEALVRQPRVIAGRWRIVDGVLDPLPLLREIRDMDARDGAEAFHGTLVAALAEWAAEAARRHAIGTVALSGGCFLNRVLAEGVADRLRSVGLRPLLPRSLPPNDGGIALGQAAVAAALADG
jgi:hydrogenase maturation protein HypF